MITFPDVSIVFTFQRITPLDNMQTALPLPTAMIAVLLLLLATHARRLPVGIARTQDRPTIRVTLTLCAQLIFLWGEGLKSKVWSLQEATMSSRWPAMVRMEHPMVLLGHTMEDMKSMDSKVPGRGERRVDLWLGASLRQSFIYVVLSLSLSFKQLRSRREPAAAAAAAAATWIQQRRWRSLWSLNPGQAPNKWTREPSVHAMNIRYFFFSVSIHCNVL